VGKTTTNNKVKKEQFCLAKTVVW